MFASGWLQRLFSAATMVLLPLIVMLGPGSTSTFGQSAQETATGPIVISPDHYDTSSVPVRDLPSREPQPGIHRLAPIRHRPWPGVVNPTPDPVVQVSEESVIPLVSTTNLTNFDGISDRDGVAPPDTNASVGQTQVVETVNTSYQVFSKTGASLFGPAEVSSIFSGFPGVCGTGPFGDPVVLYDKAANRWLISIIALSNAFFFTIGTECLAVSTGNDATLTYHRYAFSFGNNLGDYPKFGVWPDAYYASYNVFAAEFGPNFVGAEACAYDRANMLVGGPAKAHCFLKSSDFGFLPSDLDGARLLTPGEPNFFVELDPLGSSALHLFKFHVNFVTPALTTFTGPTVIPVAAFTPACRSKPGSRGICIPQGGTSQLLDSLADRLMFRLAYRSVAGHEALVVTHSVSPPSGTAVSATRWYEIRSAGTAPVVFQQGTFSSNTLSLWMGSIGMDKNGDIALGFSASSSSTNPSIYYTGRKPTDTAGTMESLSLVIAGGGSQNGGLNRWGDYSSMSIDPTDDCTFWYAQEYLKTTGSFNWNTHLNSFKFTTCH
jgi:hypothetical protein